MKSPCKDCEDRVLGCHSKCEKYLSFRSALDEVAKIAVKSKIFESDYNRMREAAVKKALKKHH